jgi:hypothetical protein
MKWRILVLVAFALLGAGCSDTEGTTTTEAITSSEGVIFGDGEMPETIPEELQLPAGSAIGSTMVVTGTGFTEVVVRINAELGISAEYFNQSLTQSGFEVTSSAAVGDRWLIEFSKDSVKGSIDLSEAVPGISQAVVRYNLP